MARNFVSASTQYLERTASVLTAYPVTMACWFRCTQNTAQQALIALGASGSGTRRLVLGVDGAAAGDPVYAQDRGTTATLLYSTTGYTTNTWHHAAAVFTSTTSRDAYIDGGSTANDTTNSSNVASAFNRTHIGARINTTLGSYFDGDIAEAGIWNVSLTAAEVAMLARGYSPLMVRPDALVAYWPLVGRNSPETDFVGNFDLTATGTSASEHPRIIRPSAKILTFPTAGGVQSGVGSSAGTATASAVGESTAASSASSAGTATVSGIGISTAESVGTSAGTSTANAVGDVAGGVQSGAGTSAGTSTASGTGASTAAAVGSSAGVATVTGVGSFIGVVEGVGSAAGTSTASAVGADASAVGAAVATGGIGHGKKRRRKRVVVEGYVYLVDEDKERALLARLAQEKAQEAQLLEARGDPQAAAKVRRKAFRIARRADMADPYERIRKDDEEVISRFIGLLAA